MSVVKLRLGVAHFRGKLSVKLRSYGEEPCSRIKDAAFRRPAEKSLFKLDYLGRALAAFLTVLARSRAAAFGSASWETHHCMRFASLLPEDTTSFFGGTMRGSSA